MIPTIDYRRLEYRTHTPSHPYSRAELDAFGIEGWDLATVTVRGEYIFKRPRRSHIPDTHRYSGEDLTLK